MLEDNRPLKTFFFGNPRCFMPCNIFNEWTDKKTPKNLADLNKLKKYPHIKTFRFKTKKTVQPDDPFLAGITLTP